MATRGTLLLLVVKPLASSSCVNYPMRCLEAAVVFRRNCGVLELLTTYPCTCAQVLEYGVNGIPHFVFVDSQGKAQAAAVGKLPKEVR